MCSITGSVVLGEEDDTVEVCQDGSFVRGWSDFLKIQSRNSQFTANSLCDSDKLLYPRVLILLFGCSTITRPLNLAQIKSILLP